MEMDNIKWTYLLFFLLAFLGFRRRLLLFLSLSLILLFLLLLFCHRHFPGPVEHVEPHQLAHVVNRLLSELEPQLGALLGLLRRPGRAGHQRVQSLQTNRLLCCTCVQGQVVRSASLYLGRTKVLHNVTVLELGLLAWHVALEPADDTLLKLGQLFLLVLLAPSFNLPLVLSSLHRRHLYTSLDYLLIRFWKRITDILRMKKCNGTSRHWLHFTLSCTIDKDQVAESWVSQIRMLTYVHLLTKWRLRYPEYQSYTDRIDWLLKTMREVTKTDWYSSYVQNLTFNTQSHSQVHPEYLNPGQFLVSQFDRQLLCRINTSSWSRMPH